MQSNSFFSSAITGKKMRKTTHKKETNLEAESLKKMVDQMKTTDSLSLVDELYDSAVKKLDRIYFLSVSDLIN